MEPGEFVIDHNEDYALMPSHAFANPNFPPHTEENFDGHNFDLSMVSSEKKNSDAVNGDQPLQDDSTSASLSKCYVFKSRLQEYAQKAGLKTPVYETIKEGPSHEPYFRSTVIVSDVRYDSLPGFFNRKAAEQSAAEIALIELAKSRDMESDISLPVHQTGLCKNLLQEYAQKMNYAIPLYQCHKEEKESRSSYYCIVEIGGIKYVGASANTKKEAEIKAARTALLAIQSAPSDGNSGNSIYTVVPCKKRTTDLGIDSRETAAALKPNKARPISKRKQWRRKKYFEKKKLLNQSIKVGSLEVDVNNSSNDKVVESGNSTAEIKTENCDVGFQNGCQEN